VSDTAQQLPGSRDPRVENAASDTNVLRGARHRAATSTIWTPAVVDLGLLLTIGGRSAPVAMMEPVSIASERIEDVYRSDHPKLWRSLYAFIGDAELASDAEAEAFAQALGRGDALIDPAAWIWRSAFRIASGLAAERRRHGAQLDPRIQANVTAETTQPDQLLDLLDGLSQQQRACVVLRYAGGFTPAEIGDLLQTTSGTVRVQLHRSHRKLRKTLEAMQ